jgi:HPt (histidine-containing phosphotransfer) domain-containing protein
MYSYLDPSKAHEFAMDQAQMLNLAQTFQDSLEKDLNALHFALAHQDAEPVQRLLHSLKGYVTFLCGPELSQHMIQLEAISRSTALADVTIEINKAMPLLKSLLSEVGRWIDTDLKSASA